MLKKYLLEDFPQPTEYDLSEVKLTMSAAPEIHERLKAEFGTMLFGEGYDAITSINADLTARQVGYLGGSIRKFKQIRFDMTPESIAEMEQTLRIKGCL